ncbi:MAG: hypothetical protein QXM76_04270 [Zestosphaera sp.]
MTSLGVVLYCTSELEKITALAIDLFAEKVLKQGDATGILYAALKSISMESNLHASVIEMLGKAAKAYEPVDSCEEVVGGPWRMVSNAILNLRGGKTASLKEFIEGQKWVEVAIGEETYQQLALPLIREHLKTQPAGISRIVEALLDKIVNDERIHEKMLIEVERMSEA